MSEIQEYNYHNTSDFDILFKQFEIEKMKFETQMLLESVSLDADIFFYEDGAIDLMANTSSNPVNNQAHKETSSTNTGKIASMYNWICKLISDVMETFSNIFSKKSHLDTKTYLASSSGQFVLKNDLDKVQQEVNAEMREGRKLIQAISSKTGVSDEVVENYVDKISNGITQHGKTIAKTAHSYMMYQKSTNGLDFIKNDLKEAANAISTLANTPIGSSDRKAQANKVYKAMLEVGAEGINFYNMVGQNIQDEADKAMAEHSKGGK